MLSDDINYEILINSDIYDIIELCHVNKSFNNLCTSNNFWIDKFKKDNIELIKTDSWVDSYFTSLAMKIIKFVKNHPEYYYVSLFIVNNERIKIIYHRMADLWYVSINGHIPKEIDEQKILNYIKTALYKRIDIKDEHKKSYLKLIQ
jgi:hypothetical protein